MNRHHTTTTQEGRRAHRDDKRKVLFVCAHNAARSQMAEGLLNTLYGDRYDAYSAGTEPSRVNPYAVAVMKEIGIDISAHRAKNVSAFVGAQCDYVITMCNNAKEACPFFPGAKQHMHHGFDDPSAIRGTEKMKLQGFRRIRDEIKEWITEMFGLEK